MERQQAKEVWRTWKVPVPTQYKGAINLQAALLLLFTWDEEHQVLLNQRSKVSYSAAARALGTTDHRLKRLIEVFNQEGMPGVQAMNMVPRKNARLLNVTQEQIELILSHDTLTKMASMTLLERCTKFNHMWHAQMCNLTPTDLSKFYKNNGITLQRFAKELGPPKKEPAKIKAQKEQIEFAQKRLIYLQNKGHDIFQLDESVFTKGYTQDYAWAPKGQPLVWDWKQGRAPNYVACCGIISARLGKVHMDLRYGSYDNEAIKSALIQVKQRLPRGYKWALFMDNASIHAHENVMEWCEANGVPVTFNAPYRPDLMGIENFWRLAKAKYRRELTEMYVGNRDIDNLRLVKDVLSSVSDEAAKKWAIIGWQHLYNAEVIPASQTYQVEPHPLQGEYFEKHDVTFGPQDPELFKLSYVDKRKLFVKTIFTAALPPPMAKADDDDSEWSPHKMPLNQLI